MFLAASMLLAIEEHGDEKTAEFKIWAKMLGGKRR